MAMRVCWAAIVFPLAAFSQGPPASPLMRGVLLERDASEFSIRAADGQVFRYQFGRRTYVERDHEIIDMARLPLGEQVEVFSEKQEGSALRFALTVHAILPVPLTAYSNSQSGALMGGVLLERDASEFSIRAADSRVFRYRFDGNTYVHRNDETIDMARLATGERVEVISKNEEGMALRLAVTVHALPPAPLPRPAGASSAVEDRPLPYGSISITGFVFRIVPGVMSLQTRAGALNVILRPDTRYMADGAIVDPSALKTNTHVSIQAGKTLYDQIEAYRVVWGSILRP
jgi:3D (Asp-Asp-Asp) domain-containing protein